MNKQTSFFIFLFFIPFAIFAGVNEDMEIFLKKYNTSANVTSGDVYQSQKAGHMTGGGITIRNQVIQTKPISVTYPHFDAGCGGIDIYTGAFSFINTQELINTLKSIGSSSQAFAFNLALQTVSPMISDNIRGLEDTINKINGLNINSCEIATQMTGALWPRETAARDHICKTVKSQQGKFADWVTSRHRCGEETNENYGGEKKDSTIPGLLDKEYNISWQALKKQSFFKQSDERTEYFMSLMGTIVKSINKNGEHEPHYFPSKIFDESFLKALVSGGETVFYSCEDKEKCLLVKEKALFIPEKKSWVGFVREKMFSIQEKILLDEELDSEEQSFLQKTRFPIYRIINVITACSKKNSIVDIYNISDIIAMDMFLQYLREAIDVTRQGCNQLKAEQWFDHQCQEYFDHLDVVEKKIVYYEHRVRDQLEQELQLDQKIKIAEEELSKKLVIRP